MVEPRQISDYQIVDVLGRGGMGVVYLAVHGPTGTPAALKTVRVPTESTLESIRREIVMLRELRHPSVVAIRDHGVADGMPWYTMDLLRGRTLRDDLRTWFPQPAPSPDDTRDLLRPSRRNVERDDVLGAHPPTPSPAYSLAHVSTLFHALCAPLAYVHGQGVVHRDLSPANIFLVGASPVLFDFGLASQFRTDSARDVLEVGGLTRGTAHYMAPEQVRGEVVDARADVYALGCIFYEALTGRPPFLGDTTATVLMQHLEDPPVPPSVFAPAIAPALDDLVMRMLAKVPRDRIGYADDVAAALERLGTRAHVEPDPSAPRAPTARAYTYRAELAGRAPVLKAFDRVLATLATGLGGSAMLIGESGVGKTRVAGEIATRAHGHAIRVITGECEALGVNHAADDIRAAPLHPLRPLLRAIADRCREGGAGETERLLGNGAGLLAAYEPSLAALVSPDVAAAAAHRGEAGAAHALGGAANRFRVLAVLRDALAALAAVEPILLVLDDLQWADELTLSVLQTLGGAWFARAGVFVLATVRAEELTAELDAVMHSLDADRVAIGRLDRAAVGAIVRDMLALVADAPTLTEFVASQSEGNPFVAAEYVRSAVDEGVLHRDPAGRWQLTPRADDSYEHHIPTPGSVQALVHRRLRSLSAGARAAVLAAATLGRACDADVLTAAAALPDELAREAIAELVQRHIVEEVGGGRLRFAHDKLREQAYAELPIADRADQHRRAARALEARHREPADLALHLGELAHHWEAAGDRARAVDYLERAAERALETAAFGEAATGLRHVLALDVHATPLRRARWERWLGEACYALGDLPACATHTRRALAHLGKPMPASRAGLTAKIAGGIGRQLWNRVRDRARPAATAATPSSVSSAAAPASAVAAIEAALAAGRMTSCYFFDDDSLGLVGAALTAVNYAERAGAGVPVAEIYAQLGYVAGLAKLDRVADAYFMQARETATATHDPVGLGEALFSEAAFHVGVGAWAHARSAATEGLAIARELRNAQEAEVALTILGHVEFATGDYAASRVSAIALYESARARANVQHTAWGVYTQGRAALYVGELASAIAFFDEARAMLATQRDHASQILCGGMHAIALARAGDHTRARATADEVVAQVGDRTPPVFTIAEGFIGCADAYLELWRADGSSRALATAADRAVANLERLARVFPIAGPGAATARGTVHARRGATRRARAAFAKARSLAVALGMPYDEAVACAALAQVTADEHAAAELVAIARQRFAALGCAWHLAALDRPRETVVGGPLRRLFA